MATRPVDRRGVNPTTIRMLGPTPSPAPSPADRSTGSAGSATDPARYSPPPVDPAHAEHPAGPTRPAHRRHPELTREPRRLSRRLLPRLQHRMDPRHPIRERVPHRPVKPLPLQPRILRRIHRQAHTPGPPTRTADSPPRPAPRTPPAQPPPQPRTALRPPLPAHDPTADAPATAAAAPRSYDRRAQPREPNPTEPWLIVGSTTTPTSPLNRCNLGVRSNNGGTEGEQPVAADSGAGRSGSPHGGPLPLTRSAALRLPTRRAALRHRGWSAKRVSCRKGLAWGFRAADVRDATPPPWGLRTCGVRAGARLRFGAGYLVWFVRSCGWGGCWDGGDHPLRGWRS